MKVTKFGSISSHGDTLSIRDFEFEVEPGENPEDKALHLLAIANFFAAGAAITRQQQQQALLDSKPDFNKPVKPDMPSPEEMVTKFLDRMKLH